MQHQVFNMHGMFITHSTNADKPMQKVPLIKTLLQGYPAALLACPISLPKGKQKHTWVKADGCACCTGSVDS